jgi:uncharacterized protein (TIGR02246 family)
MSTTRSRIGMALLTIAAATACKEEPLTPSASEGIGGGPTFAIQANVTGSPGDRAAIQQIVTTFDQAWTAGDAVTYARQYAGAEWVGPTGAVLTDPGAITGLYSFLFSVALPGTTRQSTIRNLTFLTGTVAVLDIEARVTGGSLPPPGLHALEKNVLVKHAHEWRIVQHQQTIVAPGT